MVLTRYLLLMAAIAVHALVAGQPSVTPVLFVTLDNSTNDGGEQKLTLNPVAEKPVLVQEGKSIDEGQQETTMNMVSVDPTSAQEDGSIQEGEQELTTGTVPEVPVLLQRGKSIDEGEQEPTIETVPEEPGTREPVLVQEPAYSGGGENKSIEEGEPVQTIEMVSENPPFVSLEEQAAMNMVSEQQSDSVPDGPFPVMYMAADEPATMELTSTNTQCPLMLGCCEEDCCGTGTSWQSPFCIILPDSTGFNGTHSSAYREGCIERVCCEEECCSPETKYDGGTALCVPK